MHERGAVVVETNGKNAFRKKYVVIKGKMWARNIFIIKL
jgi:hypothetical protein